MWYVYMKRWWVKTTTYVTTNAWLCCLYCENKGGHCELQKFIQSYMCHMPMGYGIGTDIHFLVEWNKTVCKDTTGHHMHFVINGSIRQLWHMCTIAWCPSPQSWFNFRLSIIDSLRMYDWVFILGKFPSSLRVILNVYCQTNDQKGTAAEP